MAKRTPRRRRLESQLVSAATPVFLMDPNRRVMLFNAGCERLTGWTAADVLGKTCPYTTSAEPGDIETLCAALAPPPDVFDGRTLTVPAFLVLRDGRSLPRTIHFHPIVDSSGDVLSVLGLISEREQTVRPATIPATHRLHAELAALRSALRQRYGLRSLIACSQSMQRVMSQVAVARSSPVSVLISGETGSGTTHIARVIHHDGTTGSRAFVPLDCAILPARELRNTLRRILRLDSDGETATESAFSGLQPGTVCLQHVEQIPRDVQQLLVDAFQPSADSSDVSRPAIRLLATTRADLSQAVRDEALMPEFHWLLSTIEIAIPALRNRPYDLEPLAQFFLEEGNRNGEKQIVGFDAAVWQQFRDYQWPGNLRELKTVIEEVRALCDGTTISVDHLPFRFRTGLDAQAVGPSLQAAAAPLDQQLADYETNLIRETLEQTRHNKTLAAKLLGIPRPKLYRRMEALGIDDREGE